MNDNSAKKRTLLPWLIWLSMAVFVVLQQYTGTFYGLTSASLEKLYSASKSDISLMAALFFLAYGIMQIPAGLILDRFNKKLVLMAATALTVGGMVLFALLPVISMGCLAALLMGVGTSFAFVGAVLLFVEWFEAKKFAFILGLLGGAGCIGFKCAFCL